MNNQSLKQFFAANLKLLLIVIAVFGIAGAGAVLWKDKKIAKEKAASNALFETRKMTDPLVMAKDYPGAIALLQIFADKYSSTRAGYETNLQIADLFVESKNPVKAIEYYSKAEKQSPDDFSKVLAIYSKAIAEEISGQFEAAVKSLDHALKTANSDFLRPEILMAQARNYEAMKDFTKAMEIYKTVQDKYAAKTYYSSAAAAFQGKLSAVKQ